MSTRRPVLYARVSTSGQARDGFSLEAQQRMAEDRCVANGWPAPALYQDVMSGRKDARPEIRRMMADAEAGLFDTVLVYRLDRLGRSLVHTMQVVGELADLGVRVVSLTQPFEIDGPLGKLLLAIYASFAEMESEATAARVRDTRRHLVVTQGKHYAVPPFGYQRTDGLMTPHDEHAEHVRWMFAEAAAGRSYRAIAHDLNGRDVRTGTGGLWTMTSVRVLLTNPAYIGMITHGRKPLRRTSKGEVKRSILPEGAYILAPGAHEAIIPEAQWRAVQVLIDARRGMAPRTSAAGDKHPWLAVTRCGACGGRLTPSVSTKGGRKHIQYECDTRAKTGPTSCPGVSISASLLSGALVRAMAPTLAEGVSEAGRKKPKKAAAATTDRQKQITKIEAGIRKEADLHRIGAQSLVETERRVKELRAQLDELAAYREAPASPPPVIDDFVGMWRGLDAEARAGLAKMLVARVDVGRDSIAVLWRPEFAPYLGEGFSAERPKLKGGAVTAFGL